MKGDQVDLTSLPWDFHYSTPCNWTFWACGVATFTQVRNPNTSSSCHHLPALYALQHCAISASNTTYELQSVLLCLDCGVASHRGSSTRRKHRRSQSTAGGAELSWRLGPAGVALTHLSALGLSGSQFQNKPWQQQRSPIIAKGFFMARTGWFHGLLLDSSKSNKYRNDLWTALKGSVVVAKGKGWSDSIKASCFL